VGNDIARRGAELLFEAISRRYERASTLITSNPPFDKWTEIFGSEGLTGALLNRITHHVHCLEMNAGGYRPSKAAATSVLCPVHRGLLAMSGSRTRAAAA